MKRISGSESQVQTRKYKAEFKVYFKRSIVIYPIPEVYFELWLQRIIKFHKKYPKYENSNQFTGKLFSESLFCLKFSFSEKSTTICAIFLMVLTFIWKESKPWGRLRNFLWASHKSWTLLFYQKIWRIFLRSSTFNLLSFRRYILSRRIL